MHTPVLLVVGESELETGVLKVRRRAVAEQQSLTIADLAAELKAEIVERRISEHVTF